MRLASKTDGVNITCNYRNSDKHTFATLLTTFFKETFSATSFDKDNKNIYALTNIGRDKVMLV